MADEFHVHADFECSYVPLLLPGDPALFLVSNVADVAGHGRVMPGHHIAVGLLARADAIQPVGHVIGLGSAAAGDLGRVLFGGDESIAAAENREPAAGAHEDDVGGVLGDHVGDGGLESDVQLVGVLDDGVDVVGGVAPVVVLVDAAQRDGGHRPVDVEVPVDDVHHVDEQAAGLAAGREIPIGEAVEVALGVPGDLGEPAQAGSQSRPGRLLLHAGRGLFEVAAVGVPDGAHHVDLADQAAVEEPLLGLDEVGHAALLHADLDDALGGANGADHVVSLHGERGHGLLDEDVLAGPAGIHGDAGSACCPRWRR